MSAEVNILGNGRSIIDQYLAEIRDTDIQKDAMRFRRNIERIGEIFAYEISKQLPMSAQPVNTPLGTAQCHVLKEQPVLATILRAGLPLHQGLLNVFDQAENTFISAYRKHEGDDASFEVEIEYLSSPSVTGKTVILCDPMLASGASMVLAYQALLARGVPAQLHVAVVIASAEGLEFVRQQLPASVTFWVAAVDEKMNDRKYIIPGLGDAGDLAYGIKE